MKKHLFTLGLAVILGSCTMTHSVVVTNNPVGSKKGKVSSATSDADSGVSYSAAVGAGKISKVGIAEYKSKNYVFLIKEYMVVTGE